MRAAEERTWEARALAYICLDESLPATTGLRPRRTIPRTPPIYRIKHPSLAMSREKRPANEAFGTSQLVKRTKSDANLGSSAVAVVNGSGANGALVQAVCWHRGLLHEYQAEDCDVLTGAVGVAYQRAAVAGYGVDGPLWGNLRRALRSDWTVHSLGLHGPVYMYIFEK
jgi:hypothetical protein